LKVAQTAAQWGFEKADLWAFCLVDSMADQLVALRAVPRAELTVASTADYLALKMAVKKAAMLAAQKADLMAVL
jgi:hypothetical protein